jgi:hypothetical protein
MLVDRVLAMSECIHHTTEQVVEPKKELWFTDMRQCPLRGYEESLDQRTIKCFDETVQIMVRFTLQPADKEDEIPVLAPGPHHWLKQGVQDRLHPQLPRTGCRFSLVQ